jgi:hypothetical protein
MLGAQARAAEYNAAKNASARQASREAEEQKLPPKPAPVSLSAYTRNHQVNRNKGAKSFVPLVLDEGDEDEETGPEEPETSTPSKGKPSNPEPTQSTLSGPGAEKTNRIRVNLPKTAIPVAPRAMLHQTHPAPPVYHVSPMSHPPPAIVEVSGMMPTALFPAHPGLQTVGMYPYPPPYGWLPGLPMIDLAGHVLDGTPEGMRRYGGMMVPTEITPTKQEQKMVMRSHAYPNPLFVGMDHPIHFYDQGMPVNVGNFHPHYVDTPPFLGQNPACDYAPSPFPPEVPAILRRPEPQHVQFDFSLDPNTATYDPQPSLHRHTSLPEATTAPVTPPRPVSRSETPSNATKDKENAEPYDRGTRLKKFMAAQQAVAKTGKTVLNNPELRKSQESKAEPTMEDRKMTSTPSKSRETNTADSEVFNDPTPRLAPKIPPGLEHVQPRFGFDKYPSAPPKQFENADLHKLFDVGSEDWLELKPPTKSERKKLLSVMSQVASNVRKEKPKPMTSTKVPEKVKEWLHKDSRGLPKARESVDELAADYSAKVRKLEGGEKGVMVDRIQDINAAVARGHGNVMGTLTEYLRESEIKTTDNPQDYFNRTKPVPEFAIERGGSAITSSLFEDERSGSYNPPNRIARDPRFRDQMKEGGKARSEDGWSHH